jgi:prepilin-type N-terminal cleavage/methylation domain-containing protein
MNYRNKARQAGFTLVEIAIVLVIIGLLLGGVLKGQSMIENAKVKALQSEFQSVPTMMLAYQDKFKAVPGDDGIAATHQTGATNPAAGGTTGNGLIDTGTWVGLPIAATNANESALFWNHVRVSGLASGNPAIGEALNAVGGKLGVTALGVSGTANHPNHVVATAGTHVVCSSGINGKLAKLLDYAMDDGSATTGLMFASQEVGVPVTGPKALAAYADGFNYTVCLAF